MRTPLLLPFLLAACDPASEAACDDAAAIDGVLDIGTGEDTFEPVADGDGVTVNWGPQGGQHVWGSLRAEGIVGALLDLDEDSNPVVDFEIVYEGERVGGYTDTPRFFARDGDTFELVGDRLVLDWFEGLESWNGLEVTITAHLVDACGRELSAERDVTLAG